MKHSSTSHAEPKPQCALSVDAGFSFTHVEPMADGRVVWQAVRRVSPPGIILCVFSVDDVEKMTICRLAVRVLCQEIDAGGKLLTNIHKEQLFYRQWNMTAEMFVMQEDKELLFHSRCRWW
ncbi:hypothetical protein D9619_012669 [Psilocybe cf. subviscida]|uniref:Uncharacterized protein n=1 Tax=Psilocybe cf. subviscida TaxID=2480587 RepID=A0A8H5EYY1_9AGAR|nr:hypothetical protein D9619_012669 [Psilocybe cf. subviscida]